MLNSITAAQSGHTFIYRRTETHTSGNPLAHAILRGATNKHGNAIPNYHFEDLELLLEKYEHAGLKKSGCHCGYQSLQLKQKIWEQQPRIAHEVLHSRLYDPRIRKLVKGLMIESYLEPGQSENRLRHTYLREIHHGPLPGLGGIRAADL